MATWPLTGQTLTCFPSVPEHVSLPFDSADDYLVTHIKALASSPNTSLAAHQRLILNDRYGALACAFPGSSWWSDSYCANVARQNNLESNQIEASGTALSWDQLSEPSNYIQSQSQSQSQYQQVLIRIPKQREQLQAQLQLIARIAPEAQVLLAGMAKHIPVALLNWLETHAEHYQQYPIRRKARLIEISGLGGFSALKATTPGYQVNEFRLHAAPGVFCADRLDPGARAFIPFLPKNVTGTLCDLGCGNGVLSLHLAKNNPDARILATDDSELATLAARSNLAANQLVGEVRHGNVLSAVCEPLDWIVCNPPFHDGHKQLTNIATAMFQQSHKALTAQGILQVVANRHLPYQGPLKKLFRSVKVVSADKKFVVFECRK